MKIAFKNPTNIHCIILEGVGLVLGKPVINNDDNFTGMKNPKIIRQSNKDGILGLINFVGDPEEITFTKMPACVYEVKEKNILNAYTQAATGIQVVPANTIIK